MSRISKQLLIWCSIIFLFFLQTTNISAQGIDDSPTTYPPVLWTNNYYNDPLAFILGSQSYFEPRFVFSFFCSDINNCVLGVSATNNNYYADLYNVNEFVAWSANRDHPVKENATLRFSQDGNLILRDADGSSVWSTNITRGSSVVGMKLMSNGNLVLFDRYNVSVWESFNYPTDTWFLGQTMKEGQRLTANVSDSSWAQGQFYLTIATAVMEAYINSSPPQLYYRYTSNRRITTNVTFSNGGLKVQPNYVFSPSESITLSQPRSSSSRQFIRLESDGHLRHYEFSEKGLDLLADVFSDKGNLNYCAYPSVCGEYGFCSNAECSCPDFSNFRLINARQINLGCSLVVPLSCQSTKNHQLLPLDNATYFGFNDILQKQSFDPSILQRTSEEQCKQACLGNCSCKMAFFKFIDDRSDGSCYLTSQLYSLMNNNLKIFGYNSSTYIKIQNSGYNSSSINAVIIGVTLGSLFAAVVIIGLIILLRRRYKTPEDENEYSFELMAGLPIKFSFEELKIATENFSRKIGQGGFGSVFDGTLNGDRVAVKRLDSIGQGIKEFLAEVKTIGSIHHINLVRLIGFCSEKSYRLLVYEYMCNGSLDKWIFCRNQDDALDWHRLLQIITDVAKGLAYLHEECRQRIVHLDIKPQNILLDEEFHAKVSDFGLSKLIDREQSNVLTTMRGTRGYLAPEWLTSIITEKADVYSFGVVVLEIVCGRKNLDYSQPEECIHLVTLLQDKLKENRLLDFVENSSSDMKYREDEIMDMIRLAVWCLQNDSRRRPSMSAVVKVLEGSMKIESDIVNDLTNLTPYVPEHSISLSASTHLSASLLSGGR